MLLLLTADTHATVEGENLSAEKLAAGMAFAGYCALSLLPVCVLSYLWYRAFEYRYFLAHTQFEGLRFHSSLHTVSIVWIFSSFLVACGLFALAIFAILYSGVLFEHFYGSGLPDPRSAEIRALAVVFYLTPLVITVFVALPVLQVFLILRRLTKRLCETTTITGELRLRAIQQSRLHVPRRGEGLADALDGSDF